MIRLSYLKQSIRTLRGNGASIRQRLAQRLDHEHEQAPSTSQPSDDVPPTLSAFDVNHEQALAWFEKRRPSYEQLCDAVVEHLPQDGVVFDVGANIGFFTKMLHEHSGFGGRAHLFEPLPHLTALCHQTMDSVDVDFTVHSYGLSDDNTEVPLYVADNSNLGWNTMIADKSNPGMTRLDIEVRRFDDLDIDDVPSLIKIDVEGAEFRVLRGMMASLERWQPRPAILCEIGWGSSHPDWQAELEVFDGLVQLGYEVVALSGEPVSVEHIERTTDVIFRPAG